MIHSLSRLLVAGCGLLLVSVAAAAEPPYRVLPKKADPAIVADGDLGDWAEVPNPLVLRDAQQVVWGRDAWEGPADLSAEIRLAWREGVLAILAVVRDSQVRQPFGGRDIWRGDHVNLWLDPAPGTAEEGRPAGRQRVHVAISPGDFAGNPPTIYVYSPEGHNPGPGRVAARRTEDGYVIEATLPVERLGLRPLRMHQDVDFEVAASDADAEPARQESLMTLDTRPWNKGSRRLSPVVFGSGNGEAPAPVRGQDLLERGEIPAGGSIDLRFETAAVPADRQPLIALKALYPRDAVAGMRRDSLRVELNGRPLAGDRIVNRPARAKVLRGTEHTFFTPDGRLTLYYAPDFRAPQRHPRYAPLDREYEPCEYVFDVSGLLDAGGNVLTIRNLTSAETPGDFTARVGDVAFAVRAAPAPPEPPAPAPTGPLAVYEPRYSEGNACEQFEQRDGELAFTFGGRRLVLQSRFSAPDGTWRTGGNEYFSHTREVVPLPEGFEVRDTFTNRTDGKLPLMHRHTLRFDKPFEAAWLGGLEMPGGTGERRLPENPSVAAVSGGVAAGMFAASDAFCVHVRQQADREAGWIRLADESLYLPPGASRTARFVVLAVDEGDFWSWLNAARRARGVNFPLKWMFAFMIREDPIYHWTDERFRTFIETKGANYLVQSKIIFNARGERARGEEWLAADLSMYRDLQKRVRKAFPDGRVKTGIYFHCYLDTTPESMKLYAADRVLDSAGDHASYGGSKTYMHIYVPTLQPGSWGEVLARVFEKILDDIGADGIFWDEFVRSRVDYSYGHDDGCSADIDPETHRLLCTKGSLALLSLSYRLELVERLQREGRPLVVNGAPLTRTMVDRHFMAFTETGSLSKCSRMLLYAPVALGDHLTERSYLDSYRTMHAALDRGCLYAWYQHIHHDCDAPTRYMFPTTPIELRPGMVLGEERIVTNRSGLFGWGDDSAFTAHVFDRGGRPTGGFEVPAVTRGGKHYAELRLPEGYMAILVRERPEAPGEAD